MHDNDNPDCPWNDPETFANPVTGTWTILASRPDGVACLVASGELYEAVPVGDPA